jgi:hypothetical protein
MWSSQVNQIIMSNINNMDTRCGAIACLQLSNSYCWEVYTAYREEVIDWEFKGEEFKDMFFNDLNGAMRVWLEKMIRGNTNVSFGENIIDEMDILIDEYVSNNWLVLTEETDDDDDSDIEEEKDTNEESE